MKQEQKIGHQNQEQDVVTMQQKKKLQSSGPQINKVDDKPAITNDEGNAVDKKHSDAGKGYNENQPTDPGSKIVSELPDGSTATGEPDIVTIQPTRQPLAEQENKEEIEKFLRRAKQAENTQG